MPSELPMGRNGVAKMWKEIAEAEKRWLAEGLEDVKSWKVMVKGWKEEMRRQRDEGGELDAF